MIAYGLDQDNSAKHPGSEDDDPEACKGDQELSAPTLVKL